MARSTSARCLIRSSARRMVTSPQEHPSKNWSLTSGLKSSASNRLERTTTFSSWVVTRCSPLESSRACVKRSISSCLYVVCLNLRQLQSSRSESKQDCEERRIYKSLRSKSYRGTEHSHFRLLNCVSGS